MIDGGPLRTSRPAGRRVTYRDESVRYQPEEIQREEQPVAMPIEPQRQREPQQYRQVESAPAPVEPKRPRNFSWIKWPIIAAFIVLLGFVAWRFVPMGAGLEATIDTTKYQAVFLSNGQVYFGKLTIVSGDYLKLTNVYYLERQLTTTPEAEGETDTQTDTNNPTGENNFQLLKYSDVLYGSEDAMIISKDDIIRYENLRSDGVVAKAIANRS